MTIYGLFIITTHPKIYNIGKKSKMKNLLSTYFYFWSKDHQLVCFNMLVPFINCKDLTHLINDINIDKYFIYN
jgi:hypothetical protein